MSMTASVVKIDGITYQVSESDPNYVFETCGRCDGKGWIKGYEFNANGICFRCNGAKGKWRTIKSLEAAAKRREAAARRAERQMAEYEAKMVLVRAKCDEFYRSHPLLPDLSYIGHWDWMDEKVPFGLTSYVVRDVRRAVEESDLDWLRSHPDKIEKAEDAVRALIQEVKYDSPEGNQTVTGKVLAIKSHESNFGYRTTYTMKMLVEINEGLKVWGTCPAALLDAKVEKGDVIEFTATFAPKEPGFGLFQRPKKNARIVTKSAE